MNPPNVLIVGAGLDGLMMAAQLLHHGIQPTIIDKKFGPQKDSQEFIQLTPKGLELLAQLGLFDADDQKGHRYSYLQDYTRKEAFAFGLYLSDFTSFPYFSIWPFNELEQRLMRYLTQHACKINWGTEALSLVEKEAEVLVEWAADHAEPADHAEAADHAETADHVEAADGLRSFSAAQKPESHRFTWVIGADGKNSFVRKSLGIALSPNDVKGDFRKNVGLFLLKHSTQDEEPFLATNDHPLSTIRRFYESDLHGAVYPLTNNRSFMLVQTKQPSHTEDEIRAWMKGFIYQAPDSIEIVWEKWESKPQSLSNQVFSRRVFLIGAAAAGENLKYEARFFGTDEGFQDAGNLGWKLAGVMRGLLDKKMLRSYTFERGTLARETLDGSRQKYFPLDLPGFRRRSFWDHAADVLNRGFFKGLRVKSAREKSEHTKSRHVNSERENYKEAMWVRNSANLKTHYRNSPLSVHYALSAKIKSGDRMPYLPLYHEKQKDWVDTHQIFPKTGFTLLILGNVSQQLLHILGQWIKQKYPQGLHLYYVPYSEKNQALFDEFELTPPRTLAMLLRPDRHIAFMTNSLSIDVLDNYLGEILGLNRYRHFE